MDIYIDVLFFENVIINYMILAATAKLSKNRTSSLRMLSGAAIGALYVIVLLLFPNVEVYYSMIGKVLLSIVMIAASFSFKHASAYIKTLAVFYISTFIFAGSAFAFMYANGSGEFISNGILYMYWQSKWTLIVLSLAAAGIIINVFLEVIRVRIAKDKFYTHVRIVFDKRDIGMNAFIDTGNSLLDPLTGTPVVVVEYSAIKEILPEEIASLFSQAKDSDLSNIISLVSNSSWLSRFRLIPFNSLGKENGMLIGFKPDFIEIGEGEGKKGVKDVVVGIYNRTLSKDKAYDALLGPELCG